MYDMKVNLDNSAKVEDKTTKKKVVFGRNMDKYNTEQIKEISTQLKEHFEFFGYCSPLEDGDDAFNHTEEWIQEQQVKFNFAKYKDINASNFNKYERLNQSAM